MYTEDELLPLSGIQHFAFCPRQWALIHMEGQWQENVRTVEGQLLHTRVDMPDLTEKRGDRVIMRSVYLSSFKLGLRGVADVVEFSVCDDPALGIQLPNRKGLWQLHPVEYKVGKPKSDDCDAVQLCAQAVCLEELHGVTLSAGELYYGTTRHRVDIKLSPALRQRVIDLCSAMHNVFASGVTPPPISKKCKLCSLTDVCVPELAKVPSVNAYYARYLREISDVSEQEEP